jgi:MFS family permease
LQRLFSAPIFSKINPSGDLIVLNGYLLVNNLVGLVGYYYSAKVIDNPVIGRKRLQMFSFAVCSIIFCITAAIFDHSSPKPLMALFFLGSFFGNFGANVTTYVMAAETYPTEVRGTCHGISAFTGKVGALIATIAFAHLSTPTIFWVCGIACGIGLLLTFVFSVDLTRLSLAEHDVQLELFFEGRPEDYKGPLNDKKRLSLYEIWTGRHGEYDPGWAKKMILSEQRKLMLDSVPEDGKSNEQEDKKGLDDIDTIEEET